jgi:hypothetical protein
MYFLLLTPSPQLLFLVLLSLWLLKPTSPHLSLLHSPMSETRSWDCQDVSFKFSSQFPVFKPLYTLGMICSSLWLDETIWIHFIFYMSLSLYIYVYIYMFIWLLISHYALVFTHYMIQVALKSSGINFFF